MTVSRSLFLSSCAGLLLIASATSARAESETWTTRTGDWRDLISTSIRERLEIGLRSSIVEMDEGTRLERDQNGEITRTFLGSIYKLDPDSDYTPRLVIGYRLDESVSVQIGYESVGIDAIRFTDQRADGRFKLDGFTVAAHVRVPNRTIVTPYFSLGIFFADVSFQEDPAWFNGFAGANYEEFIANYQAWVDAGAPEWPNNGYRRNLEVRDSSQQVPIYQFGLRTRVTEHFSIDIEARHLPIDADLHFFLSRYGETFQDSGDTTFPLDMWLYSLGGSLSF